MDPRFHPGPEPARDQNPIGFHQHLIARAVFDLLRIDKNQLHTTVITDSTMIQGFVQAFVRFGQINIFADDGNRNRILWILEFFAYRHPLIELRCPGPDIQ